MLSGKGLELGTAMVVLLGGSLSILIGRSTSFKSKLWRSRLGFVSGPAVAQADAKSTRNSYTHSVGWYTLQLSDCDGERHVNDPGTLQGYHHPVPPFYGRLGGRSTKTHTQQAVKGNG